MTDASPVRRGAAADFYTSGEYYRRSPPETSQDYAGPWKAAQIARLLRDHGVAPRHVLDVGCGSGSVLAALADALPSCEEAAGYDIAPEAVRRAEAHLPRSGANARGRPARPCPLRFVVGDVTAEPVPPEPEFDLLLCLDVFEHVEDVFGFLRKLRGRARWYAFHVPLDLSAQTVLRGTLGRRRPENGHLHYYDRDTALATLAETGYEVVDWRYTRHHEETAGLRPDAGPGVRTLNVARRLLYPVVPDLAVRLLGGYSAAVLAR